MTQSEAQAFAEKLTIIWQPIPHKPQWFLTDGFAFGCSIYGRELNIMKGRMFQFQFFDGKEHSSPPHLYCNGDTGKIDLFNYRLAPKRGLDFQTSCLDFFRKGCFLSGAPIDCTAHEQLEWTKWLQDQLSLNPLGSPASSSLPSSPSPSFSSRGESS